MKPLCPPLIGVRVANERLVLEVRQAGPQANLLGGIYSSNKGFANVAAVAAKLPGFDVVIEVRPISSCVLTTDGRVRSHGPVEPR